MRIVAYVLIKKHLMLNMFLDDGKLIMKLFTVSIYKLNHSILKQ